MLIPFSSSELLTLHRLATLNHDELGQVSMLLYFSFSNFEIMSLLLLHTRIVAYVLYILQETLLNLLLRNYLHYNLYDQAEKLRSRAPSFGAHSNQQVILLYNQILIIPATSYHDIV